MQSNEARHADAGSGACFEKCKAVWQSADLCSDAHRAGVGVTLPHHDAAQGDEWSSGEAKLFSTQQGRHSDVLASAHLPVCL